MGKKQSRRTISFSAEDFARIHRCAARLERSVAGLAAEALAEFLDKQGEPRVTRADAVAKQDARREWEAKQREADEVASGVFTF